MPDGDRCDCCTRPARRFYKMREPGMTYTRNGSPAPYLLLAACSDGCAREVAWGPGRRTPPGCKLERGPSL
jgi:hypothetical protein